MVCNLGHRQLLHFYCWLLYSQLLFKLLCHLLWEGHKITSVQTKYIQQNASQPDGIEFNENMLEIFVPFLPANSTKRKQEKAK